MRALSARERRTLVLAGGFLGVYLLGFGLVQIWRGLEEARAAMTRMETEAVELETALLRQQRRQQELAELRERWGLDPNQLDAPAAVSAARTAIEDAARQVGMGLGPSRESPGNRTRGSLRVIQLQGAGPVEAVLRFVHALGRLGQPLVVERLHVAAVAGKPGQLTVDLHVAVLGPDPLASRSGGEDTRG